MSRRLLSMLALTLASSLLLAGCTEGDGGQGVEDDMFEGDEVDAGGGDASPEALSEDATLTERAMAALEQEKAYHVRIVERGGDKTVERDGFHDETRRIEYFGILSTREGAALDSEPETMGKVGDTAFACDDGECRFTAGGVNLSSSLGLLLMSNEPGMIMIASGIQLALLGSAEPTSDTVDGVAAWKYERSGSARSGPSYIWLQKEPLRFLRAQIVQDPGESYPLKFINTTFTYGDAPPEELLRAETLTLVNDTAAKEYGRLASGYEDGLAFWNFTFPAVTSPATVALSDVTLVVQDRYEEGITMSLENKTASEARFHVTFEDADANGLVSAGDILRIETLTQGANKFDPFGVEDLDVRLIDEKGWTVTPGVGI